MKKSILMSLTLLTATLSFAQQNNNDEQAVRSLVTTLETGWNNKSGETYASAFANVHDYIVVNGMYFSNWTKKGKWHTR